MTICILFMSKVKKLNKNRPMTMFWFRSMLFVLTLHIKVVGQFLDTSKTE